MTTPPNYRIVLRGFDPAQVEEHANELNKAVESARREAADRTVEVTRLQNANSALQERVNDLSNRLKEAEEANPTSTAPSFSDLGERIGRILGLADEEANEMRTSAEKAAEEIRRVATKEADEVRVVANRYAEEVRSKAEAEAARLVEQAKQQADNILDHADREASARREEGEAFYENQRAKAAAAAADFERTLGERREKSAAEFAAQMESQQKALEEAQEQAEMLTAEADQIERKAREEADTLLASARQEAETLIANARERAGRVKRDSDRELAAATARRDSITAQLANVRQMLSTLGGTQLAEAMDDAAAQMGEPADGSQQGGSHDS